MLYICLDDTGGVKVVTGPQEDEIHSMMNFTRKFGKTHSHGIWGRTRKNRKRSKTLNTFGSFQNM